MGSELSCANAWAAFGEAIRRRVNSPSWATSTTLVSVTAVFGSTNTSTPRRRFAHSDNSTETALRSDLVILAGASDSAACRLEGCSHENIPIVDSLSIRAAVLFGPTALSPFAVLGRCSPVSLIGEPGPWFRPVEGRSCTHGAPIRQGCQDGARSGRALS